MNITSPSPVHFCKEHARITVVSPLATMFVRVSVSHAMIHDTVKIRLQFDWPLAVISRTCQELNSCDRDWSHIFVRLHDVQRNLG
jgi:hypothetical protein